MTILANQPIRYLTLEECLAIAGGFPFRVVAATPGRRANTDDVDPLPPGTVLQITGSEPDLRGTGVRHMGSPDVPLLRIRANAPRWLLLKGVA